jgi:hypothetical protein
VSSDFVSRLRAAGSLKLPPGDDRRVDDDERDDEERLEEERDDEERVDFLA